MTRRYPMAKLLRFSKDQWRAITKHCKAEGITVTTWIRQTLARELVLSRTSTKE